MPEPPSDDVHGRDRRSDCPVAWTLDLLGDRWTLLILRDMLRDGKTKYSEFEASAEGIAPSVLSRRLKELEEEGIIERRMYSDHPPRAEYVPTERGEALGPVLLAMARWALEHYEGLDEDFL